MPNPHGSFIWYELITGDPEAAGRFYCDVVGWTVRAFGVGAPGYHIFLAGEAGVAGMMAIPPDAEGMRPGWLGYVGVDDVDAAVAGVAAAGGRVVKPAWDVPEVGRIALVADPQGVPFYVMRGLSPQASTAFDADPAAIGHGAWNELATSDMAAALTFYPGQFGWTKGDVMNMGEMGDYQFIDHAGVRIGAMMGCMPGGPPPRWTYYFRVADIDVAVERVQEGGGMIVHGPTEVPGDIHIVLGVDPQGAMFALVGARGAAS